MVRLRERGAAEGIDVGLRPLGSQAHALTYAEVIERHFRRVPDRLLGPEGEPVDEFTLGPLTHGPTEVSIARLNRAGDEPARPRRHHAEPGVLRLHAREGAATSTRG